MSQRSRWWRIGSLAFLVSAALLLAISVVVGGWDWTNESVAGVGTSVIAAVDDSIGWWRADREFNADEPRVFCDRFLGEALGLYESAPEPFEVCFVSFWRVRASDPAELVAMHHKPRPGGGGYDCLPWGPWEEPSNDLPNWADELTCRRANGGEVRFAIVAERLPEDGVRRWMRAYNRRTIALMTRRLEGEDRQLTKRLN